MKQGNQRQKGHTFERWFARWFREVFADRGGTAQRGWQSRGGGKEEADVETAVHGRALPIHWECTHGKAPSVWAKYAQAVDDADSDEVPILVVKRDRGRPMVFLSLEHFEPFLKAFVQHWWFQKKLRARQVVHRNLQKTPVVRR